LDNGYTISLLACYLLLIRSYNSEYKILISSKENICIIPTGVQKDIRPYVSISHALTFPSYREGFPNVVLQASCMCLPCIVSDINGCNEIIEDQVNGLIIPVKNSEALESAMIYMIENPEKRLDMIKHSRKRILERYKQEFIWDESLKLYRSLES